MSASKPVIAGLAMVALVGIGTGIYFANEWRVCRSMEGDLLQLVDGYGANVEAAALASAAGVEVDAAKQTDLREVSLRLQEMRLASIYDRCGRAAGDAAAALAGAKVMTD